MISEKLRGSSWSDRAWFTTVFAGAVLCCVSFLTPAVAGSPASSTPNGDDRGEGTDDETIGTLPIFGGGLAIDIVRKVRDPRPAAFVEGSIVEIGNALIDAQGSGVATLQGLGDDRVRLTFHGDLVVRFDRVFVDLATTLTFGLETQAPILGETNLFWHQHSRSLGALPAGTLELPVSLMEETGALDQGSLNVVTRYEYGPRVVHRFEATSELLILSQKN